MIRSEGVQNLLDGQTRTLFGMTALEAYTRSICVRCRSDVNPWEMRDIDRREYQLSALCPVCWGELLPEED